MGQQWIGGPYCGLRARDEPVLDTVPDPPQAQSTLLCSLHGHQLLPVFQIHKVCLSLLLLFCRQWAWEGESTHDAKSILWIKPMLPWQLSIDSWCGINGPLFYPGYQHLFPFLLRVRDQGWLTGGGLHQQVRVLPCDTLQPKLWQGSWPHPVAGTIGPCLTPLTESHHHLVKLGQHFQASVPFLGE